MQKGRKYLNFHTKNLDFDQKKNLNFLNWKVHIFKDEFVRENSIILEFLPLLKKSILGPKI